MAEMNILLNGEKIMPIRRELLDELLKEYEKPDDLLGADGLLQQLTKAPVERALAGELTHRLGYEKHAVDGKNTGKHEKRFNSEDD